MCWVHPLISCSSRSGVNGLLRGINESWSCRCAVSLRLCLLLLMDFSCSQISNALSQLASVLEQMEPAWAHAFLKRTRLSDADFQGDVLAVMSMCGLHFPDKNSLNVFARLDFVFSPEWKSSSTSNTMSSFESLSGAPSRAECRTRGFRRRLWSAKSVDGGNARELAIHVRLFLRHECSITEGAIAGHLVSVWRLRLVLLPVWTC